MKEIKTITILLALSLLRVANCSQETIKDVRQKDLETGNDDTYWVQI